MIFFNRRKGSEVSYPATGFEIIDRFLGHSLYREGPRLVIEMHNLVCIAARFSGGCTDGVDETANGGIKKSPVCLGTGSQDGRASANYNDG